MRHRRILNSCGAFVTFVSYTNHIKKTSSFLASEARRTFDKMQELLLKISIKKLKRLGGDIS